MSKRGNKPKFGRVRKQRQALAVALMTALIDNGRITTTKSKAKMLSPTMDKMVTMAKKQTLASRRILQSRLGVKAVEKLVKEISPRFNETHGGYTRVMRLPRRRSDGSEMAIVEFTK
jgi:large subunit ribosomal protein L17